MTAAVKRFDDAGQYEREIRQLLPGYDVLHAMPAAVLGAMLGEAHVRCALEAGLPRERAETLRGRLMGGFHLLTRERLDVLLSGAGLKVKAELFRAFGMVGRVLEREA
ncbi:hypothetical protein VZQ01_19345 [Myxococcus faecalis]|uniref:hypothetical protein n=1 Tax=Myxococcus faecalis TaxID=3115646 RepID=UPI003CEFF58D